MMQRVVFSVLLGHIIPSKLNTRTVRPGELAANKSISALTILLQVSNAFKSDTVLTCSGKGFLSPVRTRPKKATLLVCAL